MISGLQSPRVVWLDNHLSPQLPVWIEDVFSVTCIQVRDLGLAREPDAGLFHKARAAGAVFITKDIDFAELVSRLGAPRAVILLTCDNTSERFLRQLLGAQLGAALAAIGTGAPLVEIG